MGSRSCNAYGCEREVPTIPGRACLSAATSGGACRQEGEGGAERARGRTARRRAVQALGWWQGWVRSTLDEDAARWWCWGKQAWCVVNDRQLQRDGRAAAAVCCERADQGAAAPAALTTRATPLIACRRSVFVPPQRSSPGQTDRLRHYVRCITS